MTRLETVARAIYEARRKASAFTLTPYDALPPDVRAMQETFAQAAIDADDEITAASMRGFTDETLAEFAAMEAAERAGRRG